MFRCDFDVMENLESLEEFGGSKHTLGADWLQYIRTSENSIAEPSRALTRLRLCHHTQNELWKVVTLGICYQSFIIFMQSATGKQKSPLVRVVCVCPW